MMKTDFRKCYLAVDQYGVQHYHDNEIAFYHKGLEAPQVEFIDVKYANEIERERDVYKKCAFQAQEMAKEIAEQLIAARAENERLMNVEYWPERARNAERQLAEAKKEIARLMDQWP